jgi:ZIP family zinc transporter
VRRLLTGLLVGGAVGAVAVVLLWREDTVRTAAPAAEEPGLAVERSSLEAGAIVLFVRNDGEEPVRIAQALVNDSFVDFHAGRLTVAPGGQTSVMIHYPWVAGESYEIGLLTATGGIVEYELEDAGET